MNKQPDAYSDASWPRDAWGNPVPRNLGPADALGNVTPPPVRRWEHGEWVKPEPPERTPSQPPASDDFRDAEIRRLQEQVRKLRNRLEA